VDIIAAKRDGRELSPEEISYIISGVMNEGPKASVKDYQLAAWLMAVCWRGMSIEETACLTDAMAKSGDVLDLSEIGPFVGDKHSTGGVGDKTTLVFVPLLAAAGLPMAKLSGRGLGHTGGTIDKLEAIPGFSCDLPVKQFIKQVKEIGCAIAAQTQDLAPADGKLYAMRDVTATVASIPLIAASVMSKKIAAGANLIVLDVKCGLGAFMQSEADAIKLAEVMAEVGARLKRPVSAVVTDMEQPLGYAVGHTLEVQEAVEALQGRGPADLQQLIMTLGALALVKAQKAKTEAEAKEILHELIDSGKALAKLKELIVAQGGDANIISNYELMPQARLKKELKVPGNHNGHRGHQESSEKVWIEHIDGKKIADACKLMGGGRAHKGDAINLATGVVLSAKIGSELSLGSTMATIYADSQEDYLKAEKKVFEAIKLSSKPVKCPEIIRAEVSV
jgi:pyrimidine-nucleoside phosphorylase